MLTKLQKFDMMVTYSILFMHNFLVICDCNLGQSDRDCDACKEPLCDYCDCGTIQDERSLCRDCKNVYNY